MTKRGITAKRNEDDEDRLDVNVDGELTFTLTEDQAKRLREAVRRALASPRSPKNICRDKWAAIVANGGTLVAHSLDEDGKPIRLVLAHVCRTYGDDLLIQFGHPMVTFAAEDFILYLQEQDRPDALAFFKAWGHVDDAVLGQS